MVPRVHRIDVRCQARDQTLHGGPSTGQTSLWKLPRVCSRNPQRSPWWDQHGPHFTRKDPTRREKVPTARERGTCHRSLHQEPGPGPAGTREGKPCRGRSVQGLLEGDLSGRPIAAHSYGPALCRHRPRRHQSSARPARAPRSRANSGTGALTWGSQAGRSLHTLEPCGLRGFCPLTLGRPW